MVFVATSAKTVLLTDGAQERTEPSAPKAAKRERFALVPPEEVTEVNDPPTYTVVPTTEIVRTASEALGVQPESTVPSPRM
ncbi:unannotated protein [freshwater metagenome]|uniref:Unannotated protein n=1 Tax=freshwater metagenome TaxID=449393 RepID=A0A6J5YDI5_9ZZZZ